MIRAFLDYISLQKRYSKRTAALYEEALKEFYAFMYPEKASVETLTKAELLDVLASNNLRGFVAHGLESGLSARTVNLKLSAISSYCNWLIKQGELQTNPARKVFRKHYRDTPRGGREGLGKRQAAEALIYAWSHLDPTIVEEAWSKYYI